MKRLTDLAINNHQFTLIFFILLIFLGIKSLLTMPRSEDPPMDIPGASIFVVYPGGNPFDLEELVVIPIEEALNELEDVKVIQSHARDGIVGISIEFSFDTDANEKFDEVVRQVNSIRGDLPEDIYDLQIMQWSSTDVVMLQLGIVSDSADYHQLVGSARDLKKQIERIHGIRMVELFAYPEEEVRISPDFEKMSVMNISAEDISNAIASQNANIPGGSIIIGNRSFSVKTSGAYENLKEIRQTVISSHQGSLVYLRDIAEVDFAYEDNNYRARVDGERAVFLTVKQKEGLNIFAIAEKVYPLIEDFKKELDSNIKIVTVFDQKDSVDERVNGFFMNLLQGILLVGLVIFLSLGFRASFLVITAIPLSIVIGLAWVDLAGFGIQQISIAALVIALGLLVDNSIVITENIERFIRKGHSPRKASTLATSQLVWPVVAATLTTMLAFIPVIAMPDKAGRFIQSLPVTVIFTLFASLLIALTLTPYLAGIFFMKEQGQKNQRGLRKLFNRIIEGPYQKTLQFALKNSWLIIGLALLILSASLLLFREVGVSFFPKAEKPQFLIRINLPSGAGLDKTDEVCSYVESVLDTAVEVKVYASNIGHGNPRIYYNTFPRQFEKNFAEIFVELYEYDAEEFTKTIDHFRELFSHYPGAEIQIKEFEQGTPIEAPFTLKIMGEDVEVLKKISSEIQNWVYDTPGLINIDNSLSKSSNDLWININKEKANMFGVPLHVIDMTVRTAIAGSKIGAYRDKAGREYDIVMRMPEGKDIKTEDLGKIYVKSLSGLMIPLRQLATFEFKQAPGLISHYNLFRVATITADVERSYTLDEAVEEILPRLENYQWPRGYDYKFTGELESREESFDGMLRASLLAILAILAVLVLQFRSFRQPLIIFSAVPLAIIGSVIALYVTHYTFSFTAFIGLISLIGIVVNNSIIMVDYTNVLREDGLGITDALMEAGQARFTPIILTSFTTIGGLLPLTLQGGTLWAPMGWTIIGGLLVSTGLTLVVVPVLYSVLEGKQGLG